MNDVSRVLHRAGRHAVPAALAVVDQEAKGNLRIDTPAEVCYYHHAGILPHVLRQLLGAKGGSEEGRPSYNPLTIYPVSTHSPGIKALVGRNPPRRTPCLIPRCINLPR